MPPEELKRIEEKLRAADYPALEMLLAGTELEELAGAWTGFKPMEKLVVFKLLDARRAMDLYGLVGFKEKYYLLCGFPLNSIAPVLEDLVPVRRRLFVELPRECYDRMFRQLVSERVELTVPVRNN